MLTVNPPTPADIGHIADVDRLTTWAGDDLLPDLVERMILTQCADDHAAFALEKVARRAILIVVDQRSAPPGIPIRYTYEIDARGRSGPFSVQARLRFRPFPPFLLRAFADYEARKAAQGLRPSGAQVTSAMFRRNHPLDLAEASAKIE